MIRRHSDQRRALLLFTALVIVAGLIATIWAAATYPIRPEISLTTTGGREGILLGLLYWVGMGLLGGTRIQRLHGHGVLTFHLPFILAATALGGPFAGAVVALVSTFDARELREAPWYGTLSNHLALALAAVASGVVYDAVQAGTVAVLPQDAAASQLVSLVIASLVLSIVSSGIGALTIMLRDDLSVAEFFHVFDGGHRASAASEVVLGWILVVTYSTMGWWASSIAATLVLLAWTGHDAREIMRRDPLTGLLSRQAFDVEVDRAYRRTARGQQAVVLGIDLDGFKKVNDTFGHQVGDDVLRAVADKMRESVRLTDAVARRGGDEFCVLLSDVPDVETAELLACRIHAAICSVTSVTGHTVHVGASVGGFMIEPDHDRQSVDDAHQRADDEMYKMKKDHGGGVALAGRAPAACDVPPG